MAAADVDFHRFLTFIWCFDLSVAEIRGGYMVDSDASITNALQVRCAVAGMPRRVLRLNILALRTVFAALPAAKLIMLLLYN